LHSIYCLVVLLVTVQDNVMLAEVYVTSI